MPKEWEKTIRKFSKGMADDFDMTINSPTSISNRIPSFVVRYEDLKSDPVPILKDLFKFMFDVQSIEGTVLEKRINEKCGLKNQPKALYKFKKSSNGFNSNSHLYNA